MMKALLIGYFSCLILIGTNEVAFGNANFTHDDRIPAELRNIADTEEGRRNQTLNIMNNNITTKCHNIMWPQVQIFTDSLSKGCELLEKAAAILIRLGTCTQSDIDKLQPIVCYVEPKDPQIVEFQAKLSQLLNSMDKDCNATMHPEMAYAKNETEACDLWSKIQDDNHNETVCSDNDNRLFRRTFCTNEAAFWNANFTHDDRIPADLSKIADTEEGRINQTLDIMANNITTKCHNIMGPQVQIFQGSLAIGCELLKKASPILIRIGTCTQSDIDKLQLIVCYVEPKDPKIVEFQAKLNQLLNSMDKDCNATMQPEMTFAKNETEACDLWSKIQDDNHNETVCSENDNRLFRRTFCTNEAAFGKANFTHDDRIPADLSKIADTEDGRINQTLDIMANNITTKCLDIMWPQVQIFQGSLAIGCELLKKASPILIRIGTCTHSDIDKLKLIGCYVEPEKPENSRVSSKA